jgi:hypothetical protein
MENDNIGQTNNSGSKELSQREKREGETGREKVGSLLTSHSMDMVSNTAIPVFLFYLIVMCNFLPGLVQCSLQDLFRKSMVAQNILGFALLYFLVTLANSKNLEGGKLLVNLGITAVVYAWFFMSTHSPAIVSLVVILLLMAAYIANIMLDQRVKAHGPEAREARTVEAFRNGAAVSAMAIGLAGFFLYYVAKYRELGPAGFSKYKFLFGKCHPPPPGTHYHF